MRQTLPMVGLGEVGAPSAHREGAPNSSPQNKKIKFAWLLLAALLVGCGGGSSATWKAAKAAEPMRTIDLAPDDGTRELPLKGVRNARDFTGLKGSHAPIPADHFFRTAKLSHATEDDKQVLLRHGVKLEIDLRTVWERMMSPDPLARDPRFRYVHISLMGVGLFDALYTSAERGALYVHALDDHQRDFRDVFHELASVKNGAVLFHCTSGKDRTGMVAAILLSLAGVDKDAIVHNYVLSAHYLHPEAEGNALEAAIKESPPEAMEEFLQALDKDYGGARSYLRDIGLSDDDVSTLLDRLGQSPTD